MQARYIIGLGLLVGCQGTIGGTGDLGAPPPPDVVPQSVPASLDVIPTEGQCFPLESGEWLASVSPEGHAWLLREDGERTHIRVIDPLAPEVEIVTETSLVGITSLEAWSEDDAALVAGSLWRLEGFARVELAPPSGFALPASLCGDPSDNGFLVAAGQVFEHRSDDQWWRWDPGVGPEAAPQNLITYEGECVGLDNFLWATAENGTLWRIDGAEAMAPVRFEALKSAAVLGKDVAILDGDRLWIGPEPWSAWVFPGEAPTLLSASTSLYTLSGSQLLRFDGEWVELSHDLGEATVAFEAHAGGIWLSGTSEVCHQAFGPMVRVEGFRPYERTGETAFELHLLASVPQMSLSAFLDGEPLDLGPGAEEGWLVARGDFGSVGWHAFELATDGAAARTLEVKRLPDVERSWATDIEPIYTANCTGSSCHGGAQAPDLSSYELWKDTASKIRTRVVEAKTMPPAASQGPEWSDEHVAIIAQWLEGGMLP